MQNLIAEDKVLRVLEKLRYYAKGRDKDMYDELILHFRENNAARQASGLNLISFYDEQCIKTRISKRLIQLIDDLEKVYDKNRLIIEFEGKYEELNEEKQSKIRGGISQLFNNSDFNIIGIYRGSIKVLIEFLNSNFYEIVNNIQYDKTAFTSFGVNNILYDESILKLIATSFYELLVQRKGEKFNLRAVIRSLKRYNLSLSFINSTEGFVKLTKADLWRANLREAIYNTSQLLGCFTLYQTKGISHETKQVILVKHPELFDNPDGGQKIDVYP